MSDLHLNVKHDFIGGSGWTRHGHLWIHEGGGRLKRLTVQTVDEQATLQGDVRCVLPTVATPFPNLDWVEDPPQPPSWLSQVEIHTFDQTASNRLGKGGQFAMVHRKQLQQPPPPDAGAPSRVRSRSGSNTNNVASNSSATRTATPTRAAAFSTVIAPASLPSSSDINNNNNNTTTTTATSNNGNSSSSNNKSNNNSNKNESTSYSLLFAEEASNIVSSSRSKSNNSNSNATTSNYSYNGTGLSEVKPEHRYHTDDLLINVAESSFPPLSSSGSSRPDSLLHSVSASGSSLPDNLLHSIGVGSLSGFEAASYAPAAQGFEGNSTFSPPAPRSLAPRPPARVFDQPQLSRTSNGALDGWDVLSNSELQLSGRLASSPPNTGDTECDDVSEELYTSPSGGSGGVANALDARVECVSCHRVLSRPNYSNTQWRKLSQYVKCKRCSKK
jgi:hypothetical protein